MIVGLIVAFRLVGAHLPAIASILDRERLMRLFLINRDIFIRTAALIVAWGFFTAQGARAGDVVLAANSVLHNLMLVGAFFLDGFASAAAAAVRARGRRARRDEHSRRAVSSDDVLGLRLRRRDHIAHARARALADRPDDRERGRAARCARLSRLRGARVRHRRVRLRL